MIQPATNEVREVEGMTYKIEFIERRKGVFGLSLIRASDNLPVLDFYGEYKSHRTRADVLPETEAWAAEVCNALNATTNHYTEVLR